jgi:serine/threonine-protein kinase
MADDQDILRTLKSAPAVDELDLADDVLDETIEQFVGRDTSASIDVDQFLAYLREQDVIDASQYVGAAANEPVRDNAEEAAPGSSKPARRYRILGPIGAGGMAEIRVARDEVLDRNVAIKILHADRRRDAAAIRRFVQEAKITGALDHPNIVPVHGLHLDPDGEASFTMKLVHGRTLKELLEDVRDMHESDRPLDETHSLRGRLEAFARVCDAVEYAHRKGVVHRDLKPSNIMIGNFGEIYVMDWGIAKLVGRPDDVAELREELGLDEELMVARTAHGTVVGTPAYMAPEQARGEEVDARSDVCALGTILYELVTLHRMTQGETGSEVIANVATGKRRAIPRFVFGERLDSELAAIITKATALEPTDRYASARKLATDIRRFLADEETEAYPDNWLRGVLRWIGRHRQTSLIAFLSVTSTLALVAAYALWVQTRTLADARRQEHASNALISHTAERAHAIDAQFVVFESAVTALARDADLALRGNLVAALPPLAATSFDRGHPPPSAVQSDAYDKRIALDRPAYVLAPDQTLEAVRDEVRALGALASTFHHIFGTVGTPPESMSLYEWIAEQGAPIRWAYVGTADGVMVSYPAKGGYPEEYDPRTRPWYELGARKSDVVWGNVYVDVQGQGMVLPAVTGVPDGKGGFRGVAGIETTFDWVIESFMEPDAPISESYLVDDVGRVVIKSTDLGRHRGEGGLHQAADLPVFDVSEVIEMMQRRQSGVFRDTEDQQQVLISYQRIPTIGWYYVERAPMQALLDHPPR